MERQAVGQSFTVRMTAEMYNKKFLQYMYNKKKKPLSLRSLVTKTLMLTFITSNQAVK